MAGYGQQLKLRLFLEGVEVPVIAATVQSAPNAPVQCSIQIPPLQEGTKLAPRTLVHLYFLDFYESNSPFPVPNTGQNTATNQSPTSYQQGFSPSPSPASVAGASDGSTGDSPDLRNAQYKLLFGGEVVGFQWTKNQAQRSLVLQCQDWSNYWDYAYQWNNTDLFGPGVKAIFSGGSTNLFTDFLEDESSAILRIIQTPSVQYPQLQGLLGGLVHLCEAIGGSYYYGTGKGKQFAGENIFFSLAELRLHITQMITAYELDPTASRLIGGGYDSLFGRTLGNLGQQVSIRQAINALMAMIFHETYGQPCPCYVPASGSIAGGPTLSSVRQDPNNAFIATTADGLLSSIKSLLQLITQPAGTPGVTQATLIGSLSSMRTLCNDTATHITGTTVQGAKALYASASSYLAQAQAAARTWTPGANATITGNISSALVKVQGSLTNASAFQVQRTSSTTPVPARLNQQIFRPDVWFSAPPRCNVIFPEHYHTVNYSRQFLQEPTRLLLKTNDEFFGEDELFDQFYFAPKGFTLKSGGRELQDILSNDILTHELYTGILPVFEKMGELNIFAARSGTVNGKMPKIGLAQRSCNFLYFKYRFAARSVQVTGKFNPYLAAGFPALIVDKYLDPQTINLISQLTQQAGGPTADIDNLGGTNFLANLTEIEHSVSQGSGQTTLNCSYARQPEESVEFLGVIRPDQTVQQRSSSDATRVSVVASIIGNPPPVNSLGPNLGLITAVQDVTAAYKAQNITTGRQLPLYQGPPIAGTTKPAINVPVGVTAAAGLFGPAVGALVGGQDQLVTFSAYQVTEQVPRYSATSVDLPAEEYIRPGWYGDCWTDANIGLVYQQFFNTGAITDQQQADSSSSGASVGTQNTAMQNALAQQAQAVSSDDPRSTVPGLLALDQGATIQDAVNFIVQTYSYVKASGLDVDDFIRSYTWRPIATMVDMFGSSDLTLDPSGKNVVQGIEGFHSRAFGPYSNLFGLTSVDLEKIVGLKQNSTASQQGDTRAAKQALVKTYVSTLQFARAILG